MNEALDHLLADLFDAGLTEARQGELNALLEADAAARAYYLHYVTTHASLLLNHAPSLAVDDDVVSRWDNGSSRNRRMFISRAIFYIVAAMILLGGFGALFYTAPDGETPDAPAVVSSQPSSVALLIDSEHAVFAADSAPLRLGEALSAGPIHLTAGAAQIMFKSTAVVDLIGPCKFEMVGNNHGRLIVGRLDVYVPARAHGFTVDLPDGSRVIDRGTKFTVKVDAAGTQTITVTQGVVELQRADGGSPVSLDVGREARYAASEWVFVDRPSLGIADHSPNVHVLSSPPSSVVDGALESDSEVFVFHERAGVRVDGRLTAGVTRPGRFSMGSMSVAPIPVGSVVDSYLLHFDPLGTGRATSKTIDFSITFDRPIRGVILGRGLAPTDKQFGLSGIQYPSESRRGFGGGDHVELSPDRRTLTVHLVGRRMNQLRVLVDAADHDASSASNRKKRPSQPRFSEGDPS